MQEDNGWPIGGTFVGVSDVEIAGVDMLQRGEGRVRSRLRFGQLCRFSIASLCARRTDHPKFRGGNGERRSFKETGGDHDGSLRRFLTKSSVNFLENIRCN